MHAIYGTKELICTSNLPLNPPSRSRRSVSQYYKQALPIQSRLPKHHIIPTLRHCQHNTIQSVTYVCVSHCHKVGPLHAQNTSIKKCNAPCHLSLAVVAEHCRCTHPPPQNITHSTHFSPATICAADHARCSSTEHYCYAADDHLRIYSACHGRGLETTKQSGRCTMT